jgi:hypothetical protein
MEEMNGRTRNGGELPCDSSSNLALDVHRNAAISIKNSDSNSAGAIGGFLPPHAIDSLPWVAQSGKKSTLRCSQRGIATKITEALVPFWDVLWLFKIVAGIAESSRQWHGGAKKAGKTEI